MFEIANSGRIIEQACDTRLHQSFALPPNPSIGREKTIRVSYADVGRSPRREDLTKEEEDDLPVILWCGGQFGGRYHGFACDLLAEEYGVRLLAVDRPGIGGTDVVPLEQRVSTWLDIVPALLNHLGVKYVHLASHSSGTIFVLNSILHQRQLLHSTKPSVFMFGPWVFSTDSGNWAMSTVSRLPQSWIGNWHHIARSINVNIAPVITASRVAIMKASKATAISTPKLPQLNKEDRQSARLDERWRRACESLMTRYIFAENIEGASHEAMLCLRKGDAPWGDWATIDEAIDRIATEEGRRLREAGALAEQRLKVRIYFGEDDEMIGKGGQRYLGSCFKGAKDADLINFERWVVPGTDHNDVISVQKGALEDMMKHAADTQHVLCSADSCGGSAEA